jgi:hypothetical protein
VPFAAQNEKRLHKVKGPDATRARVAGSDTHTTPTAQELLFETGVILSLALGTVIIFYLT